MFQELAPGPPDPMFDLKIAADNDHHPDKVDLGVGVYRNEQSGYHELGAVKAAKELLNSANPGHDYEITTGNPSFLKSAATVIFDDQKELLESGRVTSVQTISGTGANHVAALFLSRIPTFKGKKVYIGMPAWGNYEPLFKLVGFEVVKYQHYDAERGAVDFTSLLQAVENAEPHSIFVLQSCCHNPTGADLSREQWNTLAEAMTKAQAFPFFDTAYQGLGSSLQDDAYSVQLFASKGFDLVVCQSFSKNFGIYGERCGVLHVISDSSKTAQNVYDQLRSLIRWEFSSSPSYGSRLVNTVLVDENLRKVWSDELDTMRGRLIENRKKLHHALTQERKTPGNWEAIISTTGLFCYLPFTPQQCSKLRNEHHVYLPDNGRINIAGLNPSNMDLAVSALDKVARDKVV